MAKIDPAPRALLFQAVMVNDVDMFVDIESLLQRYYGKIYSQSNCFQFDKVSSYYQSEMGDMLWKKFYIFAPCISLEHVHRYKLESQFIESRYAKQGKRCLNLDPGYLTLYQFSLLTTKPFSHRSYLADGIYSECTLIAKGNSYVLLPWTYPDYQTPDAMKFFKEAKTYLKSII